MPKPRVTRDRGKTPGRAACESCSCVPPDATRERCRLHAEMQGHVVHFVITDITTYYPPESSRG
jgi:hypothetical protein